MRSSSAVSDSGSGLVVRKRKVRTCMCTIVLVICSTESFDKVRCFSPLEHFLFFLFCFHLPSCGQVSLLENRPAPTYCISVYVLCIMLPMVRISRPLASALHAAAGMRLIIYSGRLEARNMTKNFQSWKNTYLHLACLVVSRGTAHRS